MNFTGPWTHSRLSTFETCKLRFKYKEIDKLPEGSSPAMERGNRIHQEIEGFLNGWTKKLPTDCGLHTQLKSLRKLNPIAETLWAHDKDYQPLKDQWSKTAWCRAKLDASVTEPTKVRVIDFKTGKIYPVNEDQVRFYGMLAMQRAKVPTAQLELWYVDQDKIKLCDEVTVKDVPALARDFTRRATRLYEAKSFPAEPGLHCRTCAYRKSAGGPCQF
jgi:RecB family exonuclease